MRNSTHTAISQHTLVVVRATTGLTAQTPSHHSNTVSVSFSSPHRDTPPFDVLDLEDVQPPPIQMNL